MQTKNNFTIVLLLVLFVTMAGIMPGEAGGPRFLVDSTVDAMDANPGDGLCATSDGKCSLRAAIMESNALPGEDSIGLQPGLYQLTLTGTDEDGCATGDLDITDDLVLIGSEGSDGRPDSIIDGMQTDRVFQVFYDRVVHMQMIQIQGGKAPGDTQSPLFLDDDGGGIQSAGKLDLMRVIITDNSAPQFGGGISAGNSLTISDSIIQNNTALEGGGLSVSGDIIMRDSLVTRNTATRWGGGIHIVGSSSMEITSSEISENVTTDSYNGLLAGGGGIMSFGGVTLFDVTVHNNVSAANGGGIYSFPTNDAVFVIEASSITHNHSDQSGGGLYSEGPAQINASLIQGNSANLGGGVYNTDLLTMQDATILGNSAIDGAGIYNTFASLEHNFIGDLDISGSTLRDNIADRNGGGIHNKASANVDGVIFTNNRAESGAGFYFDATPYLWEEVKPVVVIQINEFELNEASSAGGAIYVNAGQLTVEGTIIQENSSILGGGIYSSLGNLTLGRCTLSQNVADEGGALYSNSGEISMTDTSFLLNSARIGGGITNHHSHLVMQAIEMNGNSASEFGGGFYNNGTATIDRSAFISNMTNMRGGAIYNAVYTGEPGLDAAMEGLSIAALSSVENTIDINASVFSSNTADFGAHTLYNADVVDFFDSTIENYGVSESVITTDKSTTFFTTIIASSSPNSACDGSGEHDGFYSLETGDGCNFSSDRSLVNTDPKLILTSYAPYVNLSQDSPAMDAHSCFYSRGYDFTGKQRPIDGDGDGNALCDIGAIEAEPADLIFADVPLNHWAHDYIEFLFDNGYTAGCASEPERKFCPELSMDRAASSVFVIRGLNPEVPGYLPPSPTEQYFDDVPIGVEEEWFSKWVTELYEQDFTDGCSTSPLRYCPFTIHNRAEATVFYTRMLYGPDFDPTPPNAQTFFDVPLDAWYARWVHAAYEAGLVESCQTDMANLLFRPEDELTRAEAACMMFKAIQKQVTGSVIIEEDSCCAGGIAGETIDVDVSFEASSPTKTVTEMRILSGKRAFTPDEMDSVPWEPFTELKSLPVDVVLNWSTFYVYVQYRDSSGNTSPIYFDDIAIEGQPAEPTPTPSVVPPTPSPESD